MKLFQLTAFSLTLLLLAGCDLTSNESNNSKPVLSSDAKSTDESDSTRLTQKTNPMVALVGNESIHLKYIDKTIELALFDLEWRKYELRKKALNNAVAQRQQLSQVPLSSELFLSPPLGPRLDLPRDKRPIEGNPDGAVLLSVFCSFQSSHCARLQPIVKQLQQHYKGVIGLIHYDLPQSFHRYGKDAANAAHCGNEFGRPWDYMDALYADITALNKPRFMAIGEQLGFDLTKFERCLDEKRYAPNINADLDLAHTLGLGNVPVILVNGLYTKGPQTFDAYRYYIDGELARLGVTFNENAESALAESTLPITLMATTISSNDKHSTALIKLIGSENGSIYKKGDQLSEHISLVEVEAQRIIVNNDGRLEFVKLKVSQGGEGNSLSPESSTTALKMPAKSAADERRIEEGYHDTEPKVRVLPVTGKMILSKQWLQTELYDQEALAAHFNNAAHVVEGQHLIKLGNIDDQRFYNTLGLKSGDVLMRVNDQWVHDGQNPLWDSLANEKSVSVIVMRKGHPIRYDYNIQ